ncbi:hypothetical protein M1N05_03135 [Dehalococcoidales bacterium]|nr:hypothetical protein [Dehalococcoidales bacterium]
MPLCLGVHNMRRRGCRVRPARLNPAPSRLSDVPTYVVVPRLLAHQLGVERRHQVHGRDEAGVVMAGEVMVGRNGKKS